MFLKNTLRQNWESACGAMKALLLASYVFRKVSGLTFIIWHNGLLDKCSTTVVPVLVRRYLSDLLLSDNTYSGPGSSMTGQQGGRGICPNDTCFIQ